MIINALKLGEPYRGTAKSLILLVKMCQQVFQEIIAFRQNTIDIKVQRAGFAKPADGFLHYCVSAVTGWFPAILRVCIFPGHLQNTTSVLEVFEALATEICFSSGVISLGNKRYYFKILKRKD